MIFKSLLLIAAADSYLQSRLAFLPKIVPDINYRALLEKEKKRKYDIFF